MTITKQLPLHFEFRANQTFDDFFPGSNLEIINHLQNSIAGSGERQIFLWGNRGWAKVICYKPVVIRRKAYNSAHSILPCHL